MGLRSLTLLLPATALGMCPMHARAPPVQLMIVEHLIHKQRLPTLMTINTGALRLDADLVDECIVAADSEDEIKG